MIRLFAVFVFLQVIDFGTTAAALALGGAEQNPLVQHFMKLGAFEGIALAKLVAIAIGLGCFLNRKYRALRLANWAFTGIAVWNATIIARLLS